MFLLFSIHLLVGGSSIWSITCLSLAVSARDVKLLPCQRVQWLRHTRLYQSKMEDDFVKHAQTCTRWDEVKPDRVEPLVYRQCSPHIADVRGDRHFFLYPFCKRITKGFRSAQRCGPGLRVVPQLFFSLSSHAVDPSIGDKCQLWRTRR